MSIDNALTWIRASMTSPAARRDSIALLENAATRQVQAHMVIGPRVLKCGAPRLTKWDGHDLIHVDLTEEEQIAFRVPENGIVSALALTNPHIRAPRVQFTISNLEFDNAQAHDGNRHLAGFCQIKAPARSESEAGGRYVMEATYFRPDLPAAVQSYWYFPQPHYWAVENRVRFAFSPFYSQFVPRMQGPLIVQIALLELSDPVGGVQRGCWRVSNAAAGHVKLSG